MGISHPVLLKVEGITKDFPGVRALGDVTFSVGKGEIHALVGENGAGKSTLMKIIAGIWPHGTFEGKILVEGRETEFRRVRDSKKAGIAVIHQELALVPSMTVAENISLGDESSFGGWIHEAALIEKAASGLRDLDVSLDPGQRVENLGTGSREIVEIAKALSQSFRILILDEPTAALSDSETQILLGLLGRLRKRGIGIVYISHRLNEVFQIADTITVLRDGRSVATFKNGQVGEDEIIQAMVGRRIDQVFPQRCVHPGAEVLRVEDLELRSSSSKGDGCSGKLEFVLYRGEVLGIAGLIGAGRTSLLESLFGLGTAKKSGRVFVEGREVGIHSPADAIREGMALVSEDRKETGLVLDQSVKENVTLACLKRFSSWGWVHESEEASVALPLCQRLRVRVPSLNAQVRSLSGGNQQKVVLAKWLMTRPRILLLDEPTRGIDVAAKAEIYELIRTMAKEGLAIVLVSSELTEVIGLSDRIIALSDGYLAGEFTADSAGPESLMSAMTAAFRS